jgi:DNA-binding transcriptional LysR family regulator
MSLDFLSCIQGFVAIAEYKGFSQASRHLQISAPMLTHQIKRLEESLGKKLLHRTTRYVSLTEGSWESLFNSRSENIGRNSRCS